MKMYKQEHPNIDAFNILDDSYKTTNKLESIDIEATVNECVPKELIQLFKAIFLVEAHKNSKLSAYKARKKCFRICKEKGLDKNSYITYVEAIQMKYFPQEFKKAELGRKYIVLRNWIIWTWWFGLGLLLLPFFIPRMKNLSKQINEL